MILTTWPCPAPGGDSAAEYAAGFGGGFGDGSATRVLVIPALFDEANRLRRFTVETMRRLAEAGIASVLPDLPGTNESLQPLAAMTLDHWRAAMAAAAVHFAATHVLAIRGGAIVAPLLPGRAYAPVGGAAILRQMIRTRVIASRESGREESAGTLLEQGLAKGLVLAGYPLSAAMVAGLHAAITPGNLAAIAQADVGGPGLWLRAEPGEDAGQAQALADCLASAIAGPLQC